MPDRKKPDKSAAVTPNKNAKSKYFSTTFEFSISIESNKVELIENEAHLKFQIQIVAQINYIRWTPMFIETMVRNTA